MLISMQSRPKGSILGEIHSSECYEAQLVYEHTGQQCSIVVRVGKGALALVFGVADKEGDAFAALGVRRGKV